MAVVFILEILLPHLRRMDFHFTLDYYLRQYLYQKVIMDFFFLMSFRYNKNGNSFR